MTTRLKGHALSLEWSGEYGVESSSTGTCKCGWTESASSQGVVRQEYRWHLRKVREAALVVHTTTVRYQAVFREWRAECSCGWVGSYLDRERRSSAEAAEHRHDSDNVV